jgi:hypothetical protein
MILTLLRMIIVWDKIVCTKFPMLFEHRGGVDLRVCKDLLLPSKSDLDALANIERYFLQRDRYATYPSLIEEKMVTVQSFAARFGTTNALMRQVRDYIVEQGHVRKEGVLKLVAEGRIRSERLMAQSRALECEWLVEDWKRKHSPSCSKCKLERQEQNLNVQVSK